MKTKFKYFTMAIVALLMVGVSSCSSDDTPQIDTEETKTVLLKLTSAQPTTRAESAPVEDKSAVALTTGHIYFTTAADAIVSHYEIGTSGVDVTSAELTGKGKVFENLPGNVRKVYIVGNSTAQSGDPLATINEGPIKSVQDFKLDVLGQGDISKVNLYGEGEIVDAVGDETTSTATVTVAPTVARIQINDIKPSGSITGFEVAGIFVDNYYSKAAVDGAVATQEPTSFVSHGAEADKFTVGTAGATGAYGTENTSNIHDWYAATGDAEGAIKGTPTNPAKPLFKTLEVNNIWAYNLFAGKYNADSSVGVAQPRIIIRLKSVTATEESGINYGETDQFITIKGFTKDDESSSELGNIKPGYVYTIASGGLKFDESNLSPNPNEKPIDVKVTVTLAKWTEQKIKPIL